MHPIDVDRTALWNTVFAVIIGFNILLALGKLYLMNRHIRENTFRELFRRKGTEEKNEEKRNK